MDFLATFGSKIATWWATTPPTEMAWIALGVTGQLMFSARWILQWLASEKVRASVVPSTFWYLSLCGGLMVLAYGLYRMEIVLILGQLGVLVYARNIYFLLKGNGEASLPPAMEGGASSGATTAAGVSAGVNAVQKKV
jgi:lipid-A-disaccharide synthase-like uncharacterized protein